MSNKSVVCVIFVISLFQVLISGFSVDINNMLANFNPHKAKRRFNSHEIQKIIDTGRNLINSSDRERQDIFQEIGKDVQFSEDSEDTMPQILRTIKLNKVKPSSAKKRVKRQGGVGKFTEAAKASNMKLLRIYLTMFKNLWSPAYVGGAHPLHPDVPGPVLVLFKHKFMDFFFPPVGADAFKE